MSKPLVLLTAPITTRSGYGNHARDVARALIELDKYDFKIKRNKNNRLNFKILTYLTWKVTWKKQIR